MALIRGFEGVQPQIAGGAFLADSAAVIGDVALGRRCSVWFGAVLRGDVGAIRVGEASNIQDNATIHMTYKLSSARIGARVTIAHNAVVHGAEVGDEALVGMGAIVMDNARVCAGAWVAAGSVVPPGRVVPEGQLFMAGEVRRAVRLDERKWATAAVDRYCALSEAYQSEAGGSS